MELFFPIGRAKGVEPKHIVAALANGLGVHGGDIGRINVLPHPAREQRLREPAPALAAMPR